MKTLYIPLITLVSHIDQKLGRKDQYTRPKAEEQKQGRQKQEQVESPVLHVRDNTPQPFLRTSSEQPHWHNTHTGVQASAVSLILSMAEPRQ